MTEDPIQLLATLGVLGCLWKLIRQVASLQTHFKYSANRQEDQEARLRILEANKERPYDGTYGI